MEPIVTVHIASFGYHRGGAPRGDGPDGGGFVFDCRLIPNPGREDEWMHTNGLDPALAAHLDAMPEARRFFARVAALVDHVVAEYRLRGFTRLEVAFGCTGGQHRSVYCAEKLAARLRADGCVVTVEHRERGLWP